MVPRFVLLALDWVRQAAGMQGPLDRAADGLLAPDMGSAAASSLASRGSIYWLENTRAHEPDDLKNIRFDNLDRVARVARVHDDINVVDAGFSFDADGGMTPLFPAGVYEMPGPEHVVGLPSVAGEFLIVPGGSPWPSPR